MVKIVVQTLAGLVFPLDVSDGQDVEALKHIVFTHDQSIPVDIMTIVYNGKTLAGTASTWNISESSVVIILPMLQEVLTAGAVDTEDISMAFRVCDDQRRGVIDSSELNRVMRALGLRDIDESETEIPRQGLLNFDTVKSIVRKREKLGLIREVSYSEGVKPKLEELQERYNKAKPAQKATLYVINEADEPPPENRNKLYTFYNKSAMLNTKEEMDFGDVVTDKFDNVQGNAFDLGKDQAFSQYVLVIGLFYMVGAHNGPYDICTKAVNALKEKGFNIIVTFQESEFLSNLDYADVAWFVSGSSNAISPNFAQKIHDFHKGGSGLCVFADNDPYFSHANVVLNTPLFNVQLVGNTPGAKTMALGNANTAKEFGKHLLTSGIANLFEGITICYPKTLGDFEVLGTSSDNHPVLLFSDHKPRGALDPSVGRVVVDCAFTKLYCNWDSAGTARYVSNITVWLLGLDSKLKAGTNLESKLSQADV
jgi:hypothetical protein